MEAQFTPENLFTLLILIALEAVLGFDNLLYISIGAKCTPAAKTTDLVASRTNMQHPQQTAVKKLL